MSARRHVLGENWGGPKPLAHVVHSFEQVRGDARVLPREGLSFDCVVEILAFSSAASISCGEDCDRLGGDGGQRKALSCLSLGTHQSAHSLDSMKSQFRQPCASTIDAPSVGARAWIRTG